MTRKIWPKSLPFFSKKAGFSVETACTSSEAIEILKKCRFDVVISDYRMAEMDGQQIYNHVNGELFKNIPFIIFSGMDPDRVELKQTNGVEIVFVCKVIGSIDKLIDTVKRITGKPDDS